MGLYLIIFVLIKSTFGASCCGGGSAVPSLITGDYRAQFSAIAANAATVEQTDSQGNLVGVRNSQIKESLTLTGSYLLTPYLQVGLSIPFIKNTTKNTSMKESSTGMGDISLHGAYEFLPEVGYSPWKPRGYFFLEQSIPTSPSTYDAAEPLRTDSRGVGLAATSIGLVFIKTYPSWDWLTTIKGQYFYDRTFSGPPHMKVSIAPSWSALLGIGRSFDNLRFGATLGTSHQGKREISNLPQAKEMITTEWGVNLSYLIKESSSLTLTYSDQSLLRPGQNSPLLKTLGINFTAFLAL